MTTKKIFKDPVKWAIAGMAVFVPAITLADITLPHTFTAGTPAVAAQVNANFNALNTGKEDKVYGRTLSGTVAGDGLAVVNTRTSTAGCAQGGRGIYGETASAHCGAFNFAGVFGNAKATDNGFGVIGSTESTTNGFGVGAFAAGSSIPLLAYNGGSGSAAVRLYGGAIEVDPASKPMAFRHVTAASNITNNFTTLNSALTSNDPNAIVQATHVYGTGSSAVYLNKPFGVWYSTNQWTIYLEDGTPMPTGVVFNVVVFKVKP